METKICSKCKRELDLSMFSKNKNTKDGLCTQCKDCAKRYKEETKNKIDIYKNFYGKHKIIDNVEYKFCSECHNWLTLDNFSIRKDSKDGLRDQCRNCRNKKHKNWADKNVEQSKNIIITHKICTICKEDKDISNFNKCSTNPDGYQYACKDCQKNYKLQNKEHTTEISRLYREKPENKIRMQNYIKEYYKKQENIDRRNKNSKLWYENNKEKSKQYYEDNKEYILQRQKEYCRDSDKYNSPEEIKRRKDYQKQYYLEHKTSVTARHKLYKINNKDIIRQKERERYYTIPKEQRQAKARAYRLANIDYIKEKDKQRHEQNKLNRNLSTAIYMALKGAKAGRHWEDLVDYNLQQLKEHLENQFTPEMNWNNYGSYWEIDHIIPQNTFNFETENDKDFKICWSLANLRPLEKIANRRRPKDGSDVSDEIKNNILK